MKKQKDFLALSDFDGPWIAGLLDRAIEMGKSPGAGGGRPLAGKSIGLVFEKASTRTRVSFEAAIYQLGAHSIYMNPNEIQLGRGETVADTARVLSSYLDAIIVRTYAHERLEEFAGNSRVPVINALTDKHHPCQTLADLMTILEKKGRLAGIKAAYIGDGNNVANSLIEGASLMKMDLSLACPEGFEPDPLILEKAMRSAGGEIVVLRDPKEAAGMADVIYTDVWVSMGQEANAGEKKDRLRDYQINEALLACAKPDAVVMHCLPAHRGEEITSGVMDGPRSVVFEQAANRLHTGKALLERLMAS
ncbi:MAG: ornithine carbamoyltransferase [Nitrospiraceae bacterium]|nr:ornithine carbamoyltransferase [Nitrospiraceae bacterium]